MVRRRLPRWCNGAAVAAALVGLMAPAVPGGADARGAAGETGKRPRLYVYLHTGAKSAALEEILKGRLQGLDVTVFGRFPDFDEAVRLRPPDAVLARQILMTSRNIPIALQGVRGNSDREPYVIVSKGAAMDGSLEGHVLGVLDLLGRTSTEEHYAKLLGTKDVTLKRVIKRDDLLPLIQFGQAEAALVPAVAAKTLKEQTSLPLRTRILSEVQEGLPAVGLVNGASRDVVVRQIEGLDADTNRLLEVDRWRVP